MLKYSEIPRDISGDSLVTLKNSESREDFNSIASKNYLCQQSTTDFQGSNGDDDRMRRESRGILDLDGSSSEGLPPALPRNSNSTQNFMQYSFNSSSNNSSLKKNSGSKSSSIKNSMRIRKISSQSINNTLIGGGGPGPPYQCYNNSVNTHEEKESSVPANVRIKTQSLPTQKSSSSSSNKTFLYNTKYLDPLQISPEEFASQLTILDFSVFVNIQPEELSSCGWNKKNKLVVAPNIVQFTKRFNHVSFWTVQEILGKPTPKQRSDILGHFIKIAKKLYELNNLHSLFAIISALQSASVYRLNKTWNCLSKKERILFEKLAEVFSDENNWEKLRKHIESLKLPCIPYLGLYLTDLVYIDMAHPHSGLGLESQQRSLKMNNILRIISNYQQHSDYLAKLVKIEYVQDYLNSIRYIEELQKFVEDDQYKLSLKLEPPVPSSSGAMMTSSTITTGSSSCSSKESVVADVQALASLNLSPAKASSGSLRLQAATNNSSGRGGGGDGGGGLSGSGNKFIPGHRKCRSLGTKFRSTSLPRNFHNNTTTIYSTAAATNVFHNNLHHQMSVINNKEAMLASSTVDGCSGISSTMKSKNLLDDSEIEIEIENKDETSFDSLLNHSLHQHGLSSTTTTSSGGSGNNVNDELLARLTEEQEVQDEPPYLLKLGMQGCVKRKTILKNGKKPAVASWQRYWIQIWARSLAYFPPKSFKGSQRCDFKREPCKMVSLVGSNIVLIHQDSSASSSSSGDMFEIINQYAGTIYRFKAGSNENALRWVKNLSKASGRTNGDDEFDEETSPLPNNLMSFE